MQFRNRLKKMEKELNVSEFCGCVDTPKFEFIERHDGEPDTVSSAVADVCEQCLKPIEKQIIIINYIKSKKPDWMTDEQYAAA